MSMNILKIKKNMNNEKLNLTNRNNHKNVLKMFLPLVVGCGLMAIHPSAKAELFEMEPLTWSKTTKKKVADKPDINQTASVAKPAAVAPATKPESPPPVESPTIKESRDNIAQMAELTGEIENTIGRESDGSTIDDNWNKIENPSDGKREARLREVAGYNSFIKEHLTQAKLTDSESELAKMESEVSRYYGLSLCVENKKIATLPPEGTVKNFGIGEILNGLKERGLDQDDKKLKTMNWVNNHCKDLPEEVSNTLTGSNTEGNKSRTQLKLKPLRTTANLNNNTQN